MKINNLSFPYPVLGVGDDIEPYPSISSVNISKTSQAYSFEANLNMQNSDISKFIKDVG